MPDMAQIFTEESGMPKWILWNCMEIFCNLGGNLRPLVLFYKKIIEYVICMQIVRLTWENLRITKQGRGSKTSENGLRGENQGKNQTERTWSKKSKEEPKRKEPTGLNNVYVGMTGGKSPEGLNFSNLGPQSCGNGWDLRMGGVWQQAYLENL